MTNETTKVRLTLDVTYNLNGESAAEMASRLREMCERSIGEGMLTGATDAELDEYAINVEIQPEIQPEDVTLFSKDFWSFHSHPKK